MKNHTYFFFLTGLLPLFLATNLFSQKVGVATTQPQAPFHVASSGQVNTPGGLVVFGDTTEAHLEMDFNLLQSKYGANPLMLELQPGGGNLRIGANLMFVKSSNGFVGIGTNSPAQKLDVEGSDDQFIQVHTTSSGGSQSGIEFLRSNAFEATDWRITNDGGILKFLDATDNFAGAGDLNMSITQGGNVGIGINAPESPLHVVGSEGVSETGNGYFQIGSPSSTHLRFDANEILARNGDNASLLYLQFWSGNLSLCSNDAGRVGVGNTSPQAKLHVTDGVDVSLTGGGELVLGSTTSTNIAMDGNEIQARDNQSGATLFLQADGGDLLLVPNELGQVGIGVNSAANLPSPDYLLAVDGKIIAEEIRVEVSGSWPDYVFDPGYKLTPLEEVEKHIHAHGHLPGIPSAAQVEHEGILVGEMQKAMMEKIEELTLYVIELQKEIKELKKGDH